MFLELDAIEGDMNFNVMQETNISYISDDGQPKNMLCWMYVKFYFDRKLLQQKFISDYHSKDHQGMEFIKRYICFVFMFIIV